MMMLTTMMFLDTCMTTTWRWAEPGHCCDEDLSMSQGFLVDGGVLSQRRNQGGINNGIDDYSPDSRDGGACWRSVLISNVAKKKERSG
mmetsp:Transcript_51132/g.91051  ORF Transcript_51132/g.91051 Transcript_51132/m.91051 type:complete len:88 (+) Transcript_51132:3-266(+)